MRIHYSIQGTLHLPEGSRFAENQANLVILPDGKTMSVHPVIEIATGQDTDDHRDITGSESTELGIYWEDYDRTTEEIDEDGEDTLTLDLTSSENTDADSPTSHQNAGNSSIWVDMLPSAVGIVPGGSLENSFQICVERSKTLAAEVEKLEEYSKIHEAKAEYINEGERVSVLVKLNNGTSSYCIVSKNSLPRLSQIYSSLIEELTPEE